MLEVSGEDANRLPIYAPLGTYDAMLPSDLGSAAVDPALSPEVYWAKRLPECYAQSDLEGLCYELGVNPEDLKWDTRVGLARALAQWLKNHGRLDQLQALYERDQRDGQAGADGLLAVRAFLGRYYDRYRDQPGLAPVFERAIQAGRALVLLDGMDEVADEGRRRFVAEQVSVFARELIARGNRVVVTSRIYGYRSAVLSLDVPHVTVLDFGQREIEEFARQWYRAYAEWEANGPLTPQVELNAQREERALLDDLKSNPGVQDLAANPLLLTMLALLRQHVGTLPHKRIKLYDRYAEALLQTWEEIRFRNDQLHLKRRNDLTDIENLLLPLALWLQRNKVQSGTATRIELIEELTRLCLVNVGEDSQNPAVPAAIEARKRAEVFPGRHAPVRRHPGRAREQLFGFRHLTFQEYFAARALARMDEDERWNVLNPVVDRATRPVLHENRWREPILLCAAWLAITATDRARATRLTERIFGAGSEHEDLLHRDLFLAADSPSTPAMSSASRYPPPRRAAGDVVEPGRAARVPADAYAPGPADQGVLH